MCRGSGDYIFDYSLNRKLFRVFQTLYLVLVSHVLCDDVDMIIIICKTNTVYISSTETFNSE